MGRRPLRRAGGAWAAAAAVGLAPAPAHAERTVMVAAEVAGPVAAAAGPSVAGLWGLGRSWALSAELHGELRLGGGPAGRAVVGGAWLWDVWTWVPFVGVGVGAWAARGERGPAALARAGVRRHLGLETFAWASVGAGWGPPGARPELAMGVGRSWGG